jgi:hypothetical protein
MFDLDFGHVGRTIGTIAGVDISALAPLAPPYDNLGLPSANNAWLASL